MNGTNSNFLKWANIIFFIFMVIVNSIAGGTTIIGGKNTAQISDSNPTLITPAGYVFSIWGIIYILLGVFVIFQALPDEKRKRFQERVGSLFLLSCLINIIWLFLWQFEILSLSVILMFLLLITLISIYLRLNIGKSTASLLEKLVFHTPFSVYLGWITIATIANITVTLVSINWDGFGVSPETWAALLIIVALLIAIVVIATRRDLAYGLVFIWALVGISVKQIGNQNMVIIAETGAIIVAIALIISVLFPIFKRISK